MLRFGKPKVEPVELATVEQTNVYFTEHDIPLFMKNKNGEVVIIETSTANEVILTTAEQKEISDKVVAWMVEYRRKILSMAITSKKVTV